MVSEIDPNRDEFSERRERRERGELHQWGEDEDEPLGMFLKIFHPEIVDIRHEELCVHYHILKF
jgi:hypothetical protein